MDEKRHKESHNFTWGMIVGGAVVLMLTTKKGRQILKEVSEGGLDSLEDIIDIDRVRELAGEFGVDEEDDQEEVEEAEVERKPKRRRLFKGVRRR